MDDLDRRLRALASESLDRTAAETAVDADLAAIRARGTGRSAAGPSPSWTRYAVAATLVLFVGGAVALLVTRDGGEEAVAPPVTEVRASTTMPPSGTTERPPATIGPIAEPAISSARAVAEPSTVEAAWSVSITPSSEVRRTCQDIVSVSLRSDHGTEPIGLITPTGWDTTTPSTIPACEGERSSEAVRVTVPDLEHGEYLFCIAGDDTPEGCAIVTVASVTTTVSAAPETTADTTASTAPATTTNPVDARPDSLPDSLPSGYVERRYVDEPPYFELRDVAPDGSVVGQATDEELDELLRREIPTGIGGTVRLLPEEQPYGRCDDREVVATGVAPELPGRARSLAASPAGVVVVGVDVCPEGASWGDPGTRFELRRIDLSSGASTVLHVREPGDGDTFFADQEVVYAGGELVVESVGEDGAHVAVSEPYTTEDTRYHVFDAAVAGQPIELGSACDDPGDLVGPPQFVGDRQVVVARECSPDEYEVGELVVELVSLDTLEPVWSIDVDGVAIDAYSHTVSLDAAVLDGRVWALVSGSAGVEQPIRAAAVTDGVELALAGGAIVAFDPRDLIEPWDPVPA